MSVLTNLILAVVLILCLPLFVFAFSNYLRWQANIAAERISPQTCPNCAKSLSGITGTDLNNGGVRLRLSPGTKVKWDRLPTWSLRCPSCSELICFDREFRPTACDLSDAIKRKSV